MHSQVEQLGSNSPTERALTDIPRKTDGERLTMVNASRAVCSILAGVALALVLVIAVELFGAVVHPVPPDYVDT